MNALELLAKIDHEGVRAAGSVLPNEMPRFKAVGRLLLKKGWAEQRNGRWFATPAGRDALKPTGGSVLNAHNSERR